MEDGVLAWDPQGRLRYLNALAASRLQLDPDVCLGQPSITICCCPSACVWPSRR